MWCLCFSMAFHNGDVKPKDTYKNRSTEKDCGLFSNTDWFHACFFQCVRQRSISTWAEKIMLSAKRSHLCPHFANIRCVRSKSRLCARHNRCTGMRAKSNYNRERRPSRRSKLEWIIYIFLMLEFADRFLSENILWQMNGHIVCIALPLTGSYMNNLFHTEGGGQRLFIYVCNEWCDT